jgi:hypothetical protein
MKGLWRKEFRELRPFLVLGVFLLLLDLLEWSMGQFDMQPLARDFAGNNESLAILMLLMAFAVGSGLLVREMDDRTLGFLDGLPVTRLRIFFAKTAVALIALLVYPAGNLLIQAAQHVVSRQSLDHALHAGLLWQSAALLCLVTGVGLALGLLLGFLRSLCWLALGLCVMALTSITHVFPELSIFNPVKLLDMRLVGLQWRVPNANLVTQLILLAVCGGLAGSIFLKATSGGGRSLQLRLSRPFVSAVVAIATIGIGLGAVALLASDEKPEQPVIAGAPLVQFAESPIVSARSERYSFTYQSQQAAQAQALLREADATYSKVAAILGAEDGVRIDVDLTGSMQNTEGTAFHDRIRMHMGGQPLETLAHETAHVLARRLAGGELERELRKMEVLNEGLASWIQHTVTGGSGTTEKSRFQAAVVSRRHLVTPELLTDVAGFAQHADITLQYPLGAALIDVMVTRYGRDAPGKLLRKLGDKDFPRDLGGMELWSAAFQAAGFDLSLVFDDYSRQLQSWEAEFAAQIAALPRPRGSLLQRDDQIGVDLRWDGQLPAGWEAIVRYRPEEDSTLDQYRLIRLDTDGVAWVPEAAAINEQLCFQPGVRADDVVFFENWTCLPIDSAAQ